MDTQTCWIKTDAHCGGCFGCYLDFLHNDPVWKKYSNKRYDDRAATELHRHNEEDRQCDTQNTS